MISICLKSSNINLLNSLEQLLDKVSFERIYYSQRKFKIYNRRSTKKPQYTNIFYEQ